ncbi:MAG: flagellar hook-basal body complex protein FliE [Gammaproteobacteria bacterium]|uniref:flagellar hook-basal body complex protein FliE n=1 Tax=Pseudomaricurvus alcaniphilus TaxID=1166482 RepID=UPI00140D7CF9|nr:flagellar hook-basal body complex protein FliE [Pseudomaricurvus alcaniphilus]MBR9911628.1 flagellar hook-basal body complex protein FliE [Gammaproteobacteria bacterium]NHN39428.1 flagellar hook-basal body complex protein FliE [Pseudomaricurvus alcaniphilus]
MVERVDINRLLLEMRSLKSQAQAFQRPQDLAAKDVAGAQGAGLQTGKAEPVPSFGQMLEQAVNKVNDVQQASSSMAKAYEVGDPNVDITDVMVASQKASVSFQSMVQVRNKLIEAYRDVMNMPV